MLSTPYPHLFTPQSKPDPILQSTIRYPQDIQIILRSDRSKYGNLYIGNIEAATNPLLLQKFQINGILTCARGYSLANANQIVRHYKYMPIDDGEHVQIQDYLGQGVQFIADKLLITNVLVHCVAGTNRSACLAIAYLVKERKLSFEDAESQVKARRKIINPPEYFREQLKRFELNQLSKKSKKHNPSLRTQRTKTAQQSLQCSSNRNNSNVGRRNTTRNYIDQVIEQSRYKQKQPSQRQKTQGKTITSPNIVVRSPKVNTINPQDVSFISKGNDSKSFHFEKQSNRDSKIRKDSRVSEVSYGSKGSEKRCRSSREKFQNQINNIDLKNDDLNSKINEVNYKYKKFQNTPLILDTSEMEEVQCQTIRNSRQKTHSQISQRRSKLSNKSRLQDSRLNDSLGLQNNQMNAISHYYDNVPPAHGRITEDFALMNPLLSYSYPYRGRFIY